MATRYILLAPMLLAAAWLASAQSGQAPAGAATATAKAPAKQAKTPAGSPAPENPANARYRRSAQTQPTAARYLEIQQALHDRGYLDGPVNGKWGPDSVDALKRFQRAQNLEDDGKLGALSLVALGLGPKRTTTVAQGAATPPQVE